jgi:hypothetical protein
MITTIEHSLSRPARRKQSSSSEYAALPDHLEQMRQGFC